MVSETNKLFYIGRFGEQLEESQDGSMIREAELFSIGTHRGVEYGQEDLQELVNNFDATEEVPVQIDHSESALHTVGYLDEVRMSDEGKLLGKLRIIDDSTKARVSQGLMKKLSISFYLKATEDGLKPYKLREVSLVAFPQVKSARLFSENGYVSDYEDKEVSGKMDEKQLQELKESFRKEVEGEFLEEFKALRERLDQLEGVDVKLKETQVEAKVEKFNEANKIVPAQSDTLKKLLGSFSEEQMTLFDEFMSNAQTLDFQEQGEVGEHDGKEEHKEEDEFEKFYQEHVKQFGL